MKKEDSKNIIIFGIGNSGRQDDGLGWLFLNFLEEQNTNIDLEYRYQLQIEDAELISNYDKVIFVDASKEEIKEGYYLNTCYPSEKYSFSTHALEPETILYLSNKLYNHIPEASVFGIQGYDWELNIGLSEKGSLNLDKAIKFFKDNVLIDYL
ncbi:hydrogenase maturation protease [Gaetbulibacter sp. M235]|uniref:hydrogenase maturation protease n=1 Tax=Gaetbulibacter sp. M235 TaxID=3126510 RepID=UPI00374ED75E